MEYNMFPEYYEKYNTGSFARAMQVPGEKDYEGWSRMVNWLNTEIGPEMENVRDAGIIGWGRSQDLQDVQLVAFGVPYTAKPGMWVVDSGAVFKASTDEYFQENYVAKPAKKDTRLHTMMEAQKQVESRWGRLPDPNDPEHVSTYIREVVLCATDELHELLAEVHWKPWKTKRGIKNLPAYREELADVMHFILDLYLVAGLSADDIFTDYMAKHDENVIRTTNTEYKES